MDKYLKAGLAPIAAAIVIAGAAAPAFASAAATQPSDIISKADAAITERITALNSLNTRVQGFKNQSQAEKDSITNVANTNITGLTALKAKIDGETDVPTLRTDYSSIFGSFRIYALIIPRGWIMAAADRVTTVNGLMTTLSSSLQSRITAAQSAGKDVSAMQSALSDLNAKNADALTQAQNAQSGVSPLNPDQGDKTVLASNTAAIKAAQADIKTAQQDFTAARADANTIVTALKALKTPAAANTAQ